MENELEKLKEEQKVINEHNAELVPQYRYDNKLLYNDVVSSALDKLERSKANIQIRIDKIREVAGITAKK